MACSPSYFWDIRSRENFTMLLRVLLTIVICCSATTMLRAQDVVISEYTNDLSPDFEWTEFVVVKDDANLVGYYVTDNNGAQSARQGGIRFKDIPLWRHVREGTIIVLRHREGAAFTGRDADPSDGFLDLGATDATVFDFINFSGNAGAELNIANEGDFLEVLRPDTTHVHGLGHRRPTGAYYDACATPKVNHDTTNVGNGRSIAVTGRSLAAYGAGVGKDSTSVGINLTRGFPNRVDNAKAFAGIPSLNHLAWREWREPEWSAAPAITLVSRTATSQTIEWTPLVDPYPVDNTTGVIILRDTAAFSSFNPTGIRDGASLSVGQALSTATIVAVQPNALGNRYTDSLNLKCGSTYWYRVYGYRYGADNTLPLSQQTDSSARGRQYNEKQWGQSGPIAKSLPEKPVITASRTLICPGDTVTLTSTAVSGQVSYSWTVNGQGVSVGGTTRIVVREAGTYRLRITADGGCFIDSDPVTITELPAQQLSVAPSGTQRICAGDSVLLSVATDAPRYEWYRDGALIIGATSKTFVARQAGDYVVRTFTSQGCPGISDVVQIRVRDASFTIEPPSVDFGVLGACVASTERTVEFVNTGQEPITPTSASFPAGFTLVSPTPGSVTLQPGQRVTATLRFAPGTIGVSSGNATIVSVPCAASAIVALRGERTQAVATLDRARVDYGTYTYCPSTVVRADSTFRLSNAGTTNIRVRMPNVTPPFYLLAPQVAGDTVLQPGRTIDISIQYRPLGGDLDRAVLQDIGFPISSASCSDTLRATLVAASYIPVVTATPLVANVGTVTACGAGTSVDTVVTFTNNGRVPVTLNGISNATVVGLPVTIAPGSSVSRRVRFAVAGTPGTFTVTGNADVQPCSSPITISVSGTVTPLNIATSSRNLDFGTVRLCASPGTRQRTFTIFVGDSSSTMLDVDDVDLDAPFNVTLTRGDVVVGKIDVTATFAPLVDGIFRDTVRVTLQPCGVAITIPLVGEAVNVNGRLEATDTDFGVLQSGSSDRIVTLRNTGTDTLNITALRGVVPPFFLVSSNPGIPGRVVPGGKLDLLLRYAFTSVGRNDTLRLGIDVGGVCPRSFDTVMYAATARSGIITGVVVHIPDTLRARPGDVIDVPLSLTSPLDMRGANATTMTIQLSYDPTVLAPLELLPGVNGVTGTVVENPAGFATLELTSTSGPIVPQDPLVYMRSKTYLGRYLMSAINVDTILARNIIATGDDGALTLQGDCALESRQAGRGPGFNAAIERVQEDGVELDVTILTHDETRIRVIDLQGIVRAVPLQGVLEPGRYGIRLDGRAWPQGYIMLEITNGALRRTLPLIMVR